MVFNTLYYDALLSTNNEAIRLATLNAKEGTVVVCNEQTAGRGQRDNKWVSNAGENLTTSLILYPTINPAELFLLSKTFSLTVARVLEAYGINASIKWPNDIYVGDKKIAGILIEHSFLGNNLNFSIIGLGLNINQEQFPDMNIAPTSVFICTGKKTDIKEILQKILDEFALLYQSLNTSLVNKDYMDKLYRKKGFFPYKSKEGHIFNAEIYNVANSGELTLKDTEENYRVFLFKEVEYL